MNPDHETMIITVTICNSGKAAGSAIQQDAENNLLVCHGTQDPCVSDQAFALGRNSGQENVIKRGVQVRRLTPLECEQLQGFSDGYTAINKADGPRYKALGNSMAVPVMKWLGQRIQEFEEMDEDGYLQKRLGL
jgi:DNA (cytosine-5)-methyltransferase 1